jgi:multidrug transporter EmrE-like cation transporter
VTLLLGLVLAALSALVTNVGFLLRHRGAVAAPDVDVRHPLQSAVGLFRSKWWTIGYALAVVAYLFHAGALTLVALSLVQAVLSAGIVLLAVIAERFFGFKLESRQWAGVLLAGAGLSLLALMGESRSGQDTANYSFAAMLAFECALAGIGTALILSFRVPRMRPHFGIYLGLAAGLLFTVTHVAVKAASGQVDGGISDALMTPYPLIAVTGGVVAFFASARSLQLGPGLPVIAVTSIAGNASAIPAGVIVFGDPLGGDATRVVFRTMAFVLVVAAAALIPAPTRAGDPRRGFEERGSPLPAR